MLQFLLIAFAAGTAVVEEAMVEMDLMEGVTHEHAQGLRLEHSRQSWPLDRSNQDEDKLIRIKAFINHGRPSGDVVWDWQNEDASWTYGLVRLTATGAREAMALHMLHRHGLAPLLASRDSTFQQRFRPPRYGNNWLEVFVDTEEQSANVRQLFAMLLDVSLTGLRNLHSYDHNGEWFPGSYSTKRQLKNLGSLQVCHSAPTIRWMSTTGVGSHVSAARSNFNRLMQTTVGGHHAGSVMAFLGTGQGNVTVSSHEGMTTDVNEFAAALVQAGGWLRRSDSWALRARVVWEEVNTEDSEVDIPLTASQIRELQATGQRASTWVRGPVATAAAPSSRGAGGTANVEFLQKAYSIMQDFVVTHVTAHRSEMAQSRLVVWAGEEAEIYEVALEVQQATARSLIETDVDMKGVVRRHD